MRMMLVSCSAGRGVDQMSELRERLLGAGFESIGPNVYLRERSDDLDYDYIELTVSDSNVDVTVGVYDTDGLVCLPDRLAKDVQLQS